MKSSWLRLSIFLGSFSTLFGTAACTADLQIPPNIVFGCEDNSDCPAGSTCAALEDGDGTDKVCVVPEEASCGNGVRETGEECDDGNSDSNDRCIDCVAATCGDGFVWEGTETCDAGSNNSDTEVDGCRTNCQVAACGDGVKDTGETCDAGAENTESYGEADRCNLTCDGDAPHCGDGVTSAGEFCDDGDLNSDAYASSESCNSACSGFAPRCGDGVTNGAEVCDDENTEDGDYCSANCLEVTAVCGDGLKQGDEACDDENELDGDYCSSDCSAVTCVCGDGLIELDEVCDHEGQIDGWYCDDDCMGVTKQCGDGVAALSVDGRVGEVCDEGDNNSNDYQVTPTCLSDCSGYGSHCGDNVQDAGEACDDGNTTNDENGCSSTCQRLGSCGDGIIQYYFESCDDENTVTEACDYGDTTCVVCVGTGYTDPTNAANDAVHGCEFREIAGPHCGDGIVQQRGLEGGDTLFTGTETDGVDTQEWEGCDPGSEDNPTPAVACSSLHPALGEGTASCAPGCVKYDTSGCGNQDVVYVPAGPFMMGCNEELDGDCFPDELPYREVYLDAYVIHTTEVVAGVYRPWCEAAGADCEYVHEGSFELDDEGNINPEGNYAKYQTYDNDRDDHPINAITYSNAVGYCAAQEMRLPTEAEWEKAARGTDGRVFPWGFELPTCQRAVVNGWYFDPATGWYNEGYGCSKDRTWAVGSMPEGASPYGAMDMSGNVFEWVADWYGGDYYSTAPYSNPQGPTDGTLRVIRSGSFQGETNGVRSSFRFKFDPSSNDTNYGFRCVQ